MSEFRNTTTRYLSVLAVPLWAGLLALPFAGPRRAVQVVLVVLAGVALRGLLKADVVSRTIKAIMYKASGIRASVGGLLALTRSPLVLSLFVVLLVLIPIFQND